MARHMKARARKSKKSFADAKKALPINVDWRDRRHSGRSRNESGGLQRHFHDARTPGLIAHVIEEQTREKPMRRIDPVKHGYDGTPSRSLPK